MQVSLPKLVYTQLNTNTTDYIIQNVSNQNIYIIVSDSQPGSDEEASIILQPLDAITNGHIEGKCWGKPESKVDAAIGLTEG